MRALTIYFFLLAATAVVAQKGQDHFKSEIDFGNGIVFTTFFDVAFDQDQFTITSPEDADVRIFGGKARLGRALGKSPKKGIIVSITGQQKNDSLFGETDVLMVGKLKFKGTLKNKILSGKFIKNDATTMGSLHGEYSSEKRIDYKQLYPIILKTIQDNIYSKDALQNKEWKKFQKGIKSLCENAHDDIELFLGFNTHSQTLPFSHLNLSISKAEPDSDETVDVDAPKSVIFEEKNNATAYLLIKNFSTSRQELAVTLPKIVANQNYKNLIVDLRNNPGGGIEAAFEFAKYIIDTDIEVGYFVTNKLQYSGFQPELFKTLPELQPKSTEEFTNDLKTSGGANLIFKKSDTPVFKGNIYVLTNSRTASTCEPVVYALKNTKRAVSIGGNTAGKMLAAVPFTISEKYILILPIADFYTYDGVRLDNVGVSPDVEVKSEDALEKALELINNDKNN